MSVPSTPTIHREDDSITPSPSPTTGLLCPAVAPLLLRPSEAAQALGVSRSTVYGLLKRGELRGVRIGGSRRIARAELVAYVEALRADTSPGAVPAA